MHKTERRILQLTYEHKLSHLSSCLSDWPIIHEIYYTKQEYEFLIMSIFAAYYIICVIYCLYQLFKNLSKRYSDDPTGGSPELDTIMVMMMAWVLAPIDVSLTWIRWYKEAEIARRRQEKII